MIKSFIDIVENPEHRMPFSEINPAFDNGYDRSLTFSDLNALAGIRFNPIFSIFWSRLRPIEVLPSLLTVETVLMASWGNPGWAVLWAWTVRHVAVREGQMNVNMNRLIRHLGSTESSFWVPNQVGFETASDGQKGPTGNELDIPSNWTI